MNIKKLITLTLVLMFVFSFAGIAKAQEVTTTSASAQVQALLEQIKTLTAQLEALKAAQTQVQTTRESVSSTLSMIRNLREGMTGDDVKALQAILAADPEIYPEGLITGYYGRLTSEAVRKFQRKNGIETVGVVGPKTLKKLNEKISDLKLYSEDDEDGDDDNNGRSKKLCVITPPGHQIAPGWLKKNNGQKPVVPECQNLPPGIANQIGWTKPTTTPDTIAPIISAVVSSSTNATSTKVTWNTNELTIGSIFYGTENPLIISSTTPVINSNMFKMSHEVMLNNLATSTTYYFIINSRDAAGNTSTTSQSSFVTPAN